MYVGSSLLCVWISPDERCTYTSGHKGNRCHKGQSLKHGWLLLKTGRSECIVLPPPHRPSTCLETSCSFT